jgi:dihydrodipicolinate synthase/N-acetylneuraminate lyase
MDAIAQKIGDILISQGLSGAILLVAGYTIRRLFELYREAQEARIKESREIVKALEDSTTAYRALADAIRNR